MKLKIILKRQRNIETLVKIMKIKSLITKKKQKIIKMNVKSKKKELKKLKN